MISVVFKYISSSFVLNTSSKVIDFIVENFYYFGLHFSEDLGVFILLANHIRPLEIFIREKGHNRNDLIIHKIID